MLRQNADRDPYLRHAGVMGLTLIGDRQAILAHAADRSSAARVGVLLALRRMESPEVRRFLRDPDPAVVREAARAINDVPLDGAVADLAALMDDRRAVANPVVLPRIINASYRVGTRQAAQALVTLAFVERGRGAAEQGRREPCWRWPRGARRPAAIGSPASGTRSRPPAARPGRPGPAGPGHPPFAGGEVRRHPSSRHHRRHGAEARRGGAGAVVAGAESANPPRCGCRRCAPASLSSPSWSSR